MKIHTLGVLKTVTTWGGFFITLCGASYAFSIGKLDAVSGSLTFAGIVVQGVGHLIGIAQSKREKEAKETAEKRVAELEARIEDSESVIAEFGDVIDDAPYLRKVIAKQRDEDFIRGFNGDDWK